MKNSLRACIAVMAVAHLSGCAALSSIRDGMTSSQTTAETSKDPLLLSYRPIPSTKNFNDRTLSSTSQTAESFGPRRKFASLPPNTKQPHYETGANYLRSGQTGLAINELKRSLAVEGEQAKTYNALGAAYANLQRPNLAEQFFVRSVELDPSSKAGRFNLGLFLMRQGRKDAADFHLARLEGSNCNEVPVVDMRAEVALESLTADVISSCGL